MRSPHVFKSEWSRSSSNNQMEKKNRSMVRHHSRHSTLKRNPKTSFPSLREKESIQMATTRLFLEVRPSESRIQQWRINEGTIINKIVKSPHRSCGSRPPSFVLRLLYGIEITPQTPGNIPKSLNVRQFKPKRLSLMWSNWTIYRS